MTNRANIFYDHEIENIVRNRSVEVLSLLDHVSTQYPGAPMRDMLYTVEDHIMQYGTEGVPDVLLRAPQNEIISPVMPPEEDSFVLDIDDALEDDTSEVEPEEETLTPREKAGRARRLRQQPTTEKPRERVNVRNLLDEIDDLEL